MKRRKFLMLNKAKSNTSSTKNQEQNSAFSKTPSIAPFSGEWNSKTALHLLRRTVIGPTPTEVKTVLQMGMNAAVEQITKPDNTPVGPSRYVGIWLDANILYLDPGQTPAYVFFEEMKRWWLANMINNGLNIRERMTLFWHNHFATDRLTSYTDGRFFYNQNQLFRNNAVGNFKKLCYDITLDKAMLIFLNGRYNKKTMLQENYARELQELFTIGLNDNNGNPNYTQNDVREAARVLTGWDWPFEQNPASQVYNNSILSGHDPSDKTFYGKKITGNTDGSFELSQLLDIIFEKEETARYIIRKLYRFFVYSDAPLTPVVPIAQEIEDNIIAPLAKKFRESNWEIAPVLSMLFKSDHFYDEAVIGSEIKSPVDLYVSAIRSMKTAPVTDEFLLQFIQLECDQLGMNLFAPPGVQGWQFHRSWISTTTLPSRRASTDAIIDGKKNFYRYIENLIFNGVQFKNGTAIFPVLAFAKSFSSYSNNPTQLVTDIATHLLAYPANDKTIQLLKSALLQGQPEYEWGSISDKIKEDRIKTMLKALMRLPHFQLL